MGAPKIRGGPSQGCPIGPSERRPYLGGRRALSHAFALKKPAVDWDVQYVGRRDDERGPRQEGERARRPGLAPGWCCARLPVSSETVSP